ncbi:MAG TPA: type II secretion system F family protein [Phycisphaerae bacterium]|nr:type II secretion system F family protein [Phycisphaerae bacterium]
MEIYILGALVVVAVSMVAYALMPNKQEEGDVVRRRTAGLSKEDDVRSLQAKARERARSSVFEKAAPLLSRPVMPMKAEEQTNLRSKMAQAGFRRESAVSLFLASKSAAFVACGLVGAVMGIQSEKELLGIIGQTIFAAGLGFMLPNLWLNMSIRKRAEHIRNGLPDALDLMVVGVEAGLGLDAALLRVSDEMKTVYPQLAEEFQISCVETQMGVQRSEALGKMAERSAVLEMKALTAVIAQAEKLGTSIAKALRTQAESLRTKRRQRAEERAQKTAVKLLLPLILFIFPTIFIVLAGPAAVQLMETFGSGGALNK